jgi:multicomponent Na+:H+ antiporter subunit D
MLLFAGLCILLGVFPQWLYALLPYPLDYQPYTAGKVLFYLQLLLFSGLAFFLLLPLMKRTDTVSLDIDWLWRRGLPSAANTLARLARPLQGFTSDALKTGQAFFVHLSVRYLGQPHTADSEERGLFARSWPIGTTALWIAILLSTYVLVYYI